ncbi:MAG: hypothetical protein CL524_06215 [Aequorivita sp.]|nr:hypothetical protein [Aequorivita sp.]MBF31808.1 hypothetical protein [Aequorivita sp.]|tara:strand:- start:21450 stop:22550 length:1101 start_codon:yes stop_codon:yes gene_type:complete
MLQWYVPLELNHSSYIYTALVEFCKKENISFKISSKNLNYRGLITVEQNTLNFSNHFNPKVTFVQINFSNGDKKIIAFDLNDNAHFFGVYALKHADVYFKRCYQEKIVGMLPDEYRKKIKLLGLPFMVRSERLPYLKKLQCLFYIFKIIEIFKFDRLLFKRLKLFKKKAIKHFNGFVNTRKTSDFNNFNYEVLGNIFYQKRLFEESSEDVVTLNQQRIRIIKLLKNNFTNNFYGGLQENPMSKLRYPELISNINGNPHIFLEAMKKCGICIYTNGLMYSPGWTLPEYLSQGKCIVAEPLANKIPNPLINEEHLIYFSNDKELIEICRELLLDKKKREVLGKNARLYYENYISPTIFFQNLLKSNFE